jgi:hypothetical protein
MLLLLQLLVVRMLGISVRQLALAVTAAAQAVSRSAWLQQRYVLP